MKGESYPSHSVDDPDQTLNRTAISATLHCLTGCAIGEVLGLVIATALGWGDAASIALAIVLAVPLALAADTFSIATMEVLDSLAMLVIPGAMAAGLGDPLFWGSLAAALFLAFWAAFPVNRWLIARGKGHAVVHQFHEGHGGHGGHEHDSA